MVVGVLEWHPEISNRSQEASVEPSKRFKRTPEKVLSNIKRFYRNPIWLPKRFYRTSERVFRTTARVLSNLLHWTPPPPPFWGCLKKNFPCMGGKAWRFKSALHQSKVNRKHRQCAVPETPEQTPRKVKYATTAGQMNRWGKKGCIGTRLNTCAACTLRFVTLCK